GLQMTDTDLIEIGSAQQAESLVRDSDFLLLGFKAPWCPQCEPQRGVVKRVQGKFGARVRFAYLDLAADESGAQAFAVQALPTLVLFKQGREAARLSGFTPAPKLISSLDALLSSD
ncbi:MAG: thioredoxin family protein, partial [Gammaproteobacteria bacterium]|nr:thioredoxin family protein [Gammaproteobacteria bacterium]